MGWECPKWQLNYYTQCLPSLWIFNVKKKNDVHCRNFKKSAALMLMLWMHGKSHLSYYCMLPIKSSNTFFKKAFQESKTVLVVPRTLKHPKKLPKDNGIPLWFPFQVVPSIRVAHSLVWQIGCNYCTAETIKCRLSHLGIILSPSKQMWEEETFT